MPGIDEQLLSAQLADQQRQAKMEGANEGRHEQSGAKSYYDPLTQTAYNLNKLLKAKNTLEASKNAIKMGVEMRQAIKQGDFSGSNFITVLLLSVLKDFVDIAAIGTVGTLINIPISILLFLVFFLQLSTIKKYILKRFIWPIIIESIPFISTFPTYTISTLWLKMKIDKRNKEMREQLDQLEKKFNLNKNREYARNV